ncbi:hypothetical protein D3C80_1821810 [compost metagenome]
MLHAGGDVGGKNQAAGGAVALDQFLQARLVDRHAACIEQRDLLFVQVEAEHIVAQLRQASAGDEADIAAADNGDFHGFRSDSLVPRAGPQPSVSERRGA